MTTPNRAHYGVVFEAGRKTNPSGCGYQGLKARKRSPNRPNVGAEGSKPTWDRKTKLKAKRLYVVEGLSPKEISKRIDVPVQTISNWAWKQGWARNRGEMESKALAQVEDQARAEIQGALESVAVRTEELVERGLDLAEQAADECDAKGFAMAAKGVQSLHSVWRQARGIDSSGGAAAGRAEASMFVFARFGEAQKPAEKSAQPIEVSATEKQPDDMTLDFEQSQQGEAERSESAQLIGNRAQVVENRRAS